MISVTFLLFRSVQSDRDCYVSCALTSSMQHVKSSEQWMFDISLEKFLLFSIDLNVHLKKVYNWQLLISRFYSSRWWLAEYWLNVDGSELGLSTLGSLFLDLEDNTAVPQQKDPTDIAFLCVFQTKYMLFWKNLNGFTQHSTNV